MSERAPTSTPPPQQLTQQLKPDEKPLVWSHATRGTVEGLLVLTTDRILFVPDRGTDGLVARRAVQPQSVRLNGGHLELESQAGRLVVDGLEPQAARVFAAVLVPSLGDETTRPTAEALRHALRQATSMPEHEEVAFTAATATPPKRAPASQRRMPKARSKRQAQTIVYGGALLVVVIIAVIIAVNSSGKSATPKQQAIAYINSLGTDASRVAANVQAVEIALGSKSSADTIALDAQQAHDNLNNVRQDFANTNTTSGTLGNAELGVFAGANDLKNAMGALVAYAGSRNPATLAQFKSQFQKASGEWNAGISTVWQTAGRSRPPTV